MMPLILVVCEMECEPEKKKNRSNHDLENVVNREGVHK